MPMRIRPMSEIEGNTTSLFGNNSLMFPKSIMESIALKQPEPTFQKKAKFDKNFSQKNKDMLFEIWASRDEKLVEAQRALKTTDILVKVPQKVSDYDVVRLVSEGLITNKGNRLVAFTDRGKLALGMAIMSQPSEFEKKKTKSKFVFSQIGDTNANFDFDQIEDTNTKMDINKQLEALGLDLNDPLAQSFLHSIKDNFAENNFQELQPEKAPALFEMTKDTNLQEQSDAYDQVSQ